MLRILFLLTCFSLTACTSPLRVSPLVLASCPPLEPARQMDTEFGRLVRMKEIERRYSDCREAALKDL